MHIEYLEYFRTFAETLSISMTAREYYLTPQGVSRALHLLEKDFGVSLFYRRGNSVYLTEAGLEFSKKASDILGTYEALKQSMNGYTSKSTQQDSLPEPVYVSTTSCVSTYLLGLVNIHKPGEFTFPLRLSETNIYRIIPKITPNAGEKILGIVSIPMIPKYIDYIDGNLDAQEIKIIPLIDSPLVGVISSSSHLVSKGYANNEDIKNMPVAVYQNMVLLDALDDYVREDMFQTRSNNKAVIDLQIRDNNAIGFSPKLIEGMQAQLPEGATTICLEGFFDTRFAFVATDECYNDPHVQEIVKYVSSFFFENQNSPRYGGTYTYLM